MRNYFYFNQRERKGILILLSLILIIFCSGFFLNPPDDEFPNTDKKAMIRWVDSLHQKPKQAVQSKQKITKKKKYHPPKKKKKLNIELNSTDSTELTKIYGIGPYFASRIIKYRNILGGYYKVTQLKEVYGINSTKFQEIKSNFIPCDTAKLKRLNFNSATFKELLKHPYLSYEIVKKIANARRKEKFDSLDDLKNRMIIPDSVYLKLLPYIKLKK
jgi:DNA uptake protein ComE-like DNA-binding protein